MGGYYLHGRLLNNARELYDLRHLGVKPYLVDILQFWSKLASIPGKDEGKLLRCVTTCMHYMGTLRDVILWDIVGVLMQSRHSGTHECKE